MSDSKRTIGTSVKAIDPMSDWQAGYHVSAGGRMSCESALIGLDRDDPGFWCEDCQQWCRSGCKIEAAFNHRMPYDAMEWEYEE
jgi:hypothetical protein